METLNPANSETAAELRDMIARRQVCYEIWPEWAIVEGRKVKVGFELNLCAAAAPGHSPGVETFERLKELAISVLPAGMAATDFEILPFDSSIHASPHRRFRPEVVLQVRLQHKRGFDQQIDESEQQCLRVTESQLKKFGVRRAN